jgi:hypothetical protein
VKKYRIIKNTYPHHPNVAHGKVGDIVHWEVSSKGVSLIRDSDQKSIFGRNRYSSTKPDDRPTVGCIAQIKKHDYQLVIEEVEEI